MASNPMQRKARNSFLLGMFLMLIITGIIIALLFLQLKNYQEKEAKQKTLLTSIYVLNQEVKSGQIITGDMLARKEVYSSMIPNNAIGDVDTLDIYSLQDKEGNAVSSRVEDGQSTLYITIDGQAYKLQQEETVNANGEANYYIERNKEKQYIQLNSIPVIAKVAMQANTILTRELITKGNNTTSDDIRKQEYNVVVLPTQLQTGDYIDIRLSMPSGEDYIVVSKKEVTVPAMGDTDSLDTIWLNLSESEILSMSSAIMDAFKTEGSKLYATTYTEPGFQAAATPTYPPNAEVVQQMLVNPNALPQAIQALRERYNGDQRNRINQNLQNNLDTADENVKTKVQESIQKTQEQRQEYLEELSSGTTSTTTTNSTTNSTAQ